MPELAPPNEQWKAHAQVLDAIERTVLAQGRLELQLRQQLAALITDMPAAYIAYGPDALALQLGQSPQTVRRWVEEARMFCDYPVLLGLVNDGTWTPKHADAVLDEIQILPVDLQDDAIALVLQRDDARTPYELRRAARAAVMVLDLDAASKRADKTRKDRRVTFTDNGHGGAAAIVDGPTSSLAMLSAALDAHALPRQAGDARSLDQRRFDTLIDLVCGRLVPGNWQAHVLVTLATLEGGNELAEIPGFGLITAGEARELLAHADLQRVVLDEHGQLVSIDSRTFHPDNPGAGAGEATLFDPQQDEPFPDLLQEHDLVELDEHDAAVPDSDRAWVLSELHAAWQDAAFEAFVADAMSHLDTEVHSYLDAHALIHAHALVHAHAPAHTCGHLPRTTGTGAQGTGSDAPLPRDEPNSLRPPPDEPRHQPDPPPGAPEDLDNPADPEDPDDPGRSGGSRRPHPPPGSPDQPGPLSPDPTVEPSVDPNTPPTFSEQAWENDSFARQLQHDWIDQAVARQRGGSLRTEAPAGASVRGLPARSSSSWTLAGLLKADRWMRATPPAPKPDASNGYPFTGRLAKHLKMRDQTCTFPGCWLLARRCQSDHLIEWPQGLTHVDNGACECVHHHQAKHSYFHVARLPGGTIRWTSRTSKHYDRRPRSLIPGR